jgi:TonB family protein
MWFHRRTAPRPGSIATQCRRIAPRNSGACAALCVLLLPYLAQAQTRANISPAPRAANAVGEEKPARIETSGSIPARGADRLRVRTDVGNLHFLTGDGAVVTYRVIGQADSPEPAAREFLREFRMEAAQTSSGIVLHSQSSQRAFHGRFQITLEVYVPGGISVDAETGVGSIEAQNITRDLRVATGGGNINVGDVQGNLRAVTAGGQIRCGDVHGNADLHTGGGHIHAGRIFGTGTLETGGGDIDVQSARANLTAATEGGQVALGDAGGDVRARTGGGSLRIQRITAPVTVDADGPVVLASAAFPVNVTTSAGRITAWLDQAAEHLPASTPTGRAASQMSSADGDIVVHVSRDRSMTIDALVDREQGHRIVVDPSLPLRVSYQDSGMDPRSTHCRCSLNGGGEILKLRASSGDIVLLPSAPASQSIARAAAWDAASPAGPGLVDSQESDGGIGPAALFEEIFDRFEEKVWDGVPVTADELQRHLAYSVSPIYPAVARTAGVEGDVLLRVYVSSQGAVTQLKGLEGPAILMRSAIAAVRQWRYQPLTMHGRPVNVVSDLLVAFRLQ